MRDRWVEFEWFFFKDEIIILYNSSLLEKDGWILSGFFLKMRE